MARGVRPSPLWHAPQWNANKQKGGDTAGLHKQAGPLGGEGEAAGLVAGWEGASPRRGPGPRPEDWGTVLVLPTASVASSGPVPRAETRQRPDAPGRSVMGDPELGGGRPHPAVVCVLSAPLGERQTLPTVLSTFFFFWQGLQIILLKVDRCHDSPRSALVRT